MEIREGWYKNRGGERVWVFKCPKGYSDGVYDDWIAMTQCGGVTALNREGLLLSQQSSDFDLIARESEECDSFDWVAPRKSDGELLIEACFTNGFAMTVREAEKVAELFLQKIKERDSNG